MTNEKILKTALLQSAYDFGCRPEDFLSAENTVVLSKADPKARKYLQLPFELDMVTYGNGIVAQTSERLRETAENYIDRYPAEHCFETPNLHALDCELEKFGLKICFMAEYFLPDINLLKILPCRYEIKILHPSDFADLYADEWGNALCKKRKELDVLAVGAYDKGKLIGLAGGSADCETMYQIGIDVLPEYRRQGVASFLTSRLANEILKLGKVPFYCAAWCNIKSVRNAIKCGFRPAWAEITARDINFVNELNKIQTEGKYE